MYSSLDQDVFNKPIMAEILDMETKIKKHRFWEEICWEKCTESYHHSPLSFLNISGGFEELLNTPAKDIY